MSTENRLGHRLTAKQVEAMREAILAWLADHPGSSKGEIAAGIGVDTRKLGLQLRMLKAGRKVRTSGTRAHMLYYVADDENS